MLDSHVPSPASPEQAAEPSPGERGQRLHRERGPLAQGQGTQRSVTMRCHLRGLPQPLPLGVSLGTVPAREPGGLTTKRSDSVSGAVLGLYGMIRFL